MAAPLILMNGPSPRPLIRWIARATSSFPVPVSPVIITESGETAAFSISLRISRHPVERPTMPNHPLFSSSPVPSMAATAEVRTALPTTRRSSASSNGFEM